MIKKILPIIIDSNNDLSKKMSSLNKTHLYCQTTGDELYEKLKSETYKHFNFIFITSDRVLIDKIKNDFPEDHIALIKSDDNIDTDSVDDENEFMDINDLLLKYSHDEFIYYSNRELNNILNNIDTYKKINLNLVFTGDNHDKINMIIKYLKNHKIYDDKYVISPETIGIGFDDKITDIVDTYIKMDSIKIDSIKNNSSIDQIYQTKLYDLIDKKKYINHWQALDILVSDIKDKDDDTKNKLICIIDTNDFDLESHSHLNNILSSISKIIEEVKHEECISLYKDIYAIGTCRVMKYYMLMYRYYGSYIFKNNVRNLDENNIVIFSRNEYDDLSSKYSLRSDCQLFEHMYEFSDLILTRMYDFKLKHNNKKVVLVTYFGIYEQFIHVEKALNLLNYDVIDYPYTKYINDYGRGYAVSVMKKLIEAKPAFVLWWTLNIEKVDLECLKNYDQTTRHVYFNWDEPYNWTHVDAENKAKYLDIAFITCAETVNRYIEAGTKHAYCLYTGFEPTKHKPMTFDSYLYDVSFICTNLYEDETLYPDQIVNRKKIIDNLYNNQDKYGYTFALFGSEKFEEMYPKSYKGFVKYDDAPEIFNRSKINMCTHVVGNKKGYLNERVFLIMACMGLLMVDPVSSDILVNGHNCITMMNENKIIHQVSKILKNYAKYETIKRNGYITSQNYTWNDWGLRLHEKVQSKS